MYAIVVPSPDVVVRFIPTSFTVGPSGRRTNAVASASNTKATTTLIRFPMQSTYPIVLRYSSRLFRVRAVPSSTRIWSKASRSALDWHSIVMVSVVLPSCSLKTSVSYDSPFDTGLGAAEDEPRGRSDFAVEAGEGIFRSFRPTIHESKCAVRPKVDFTNGKRRAAWVPPVRNVLGLRPGFEDECPRRIEDPLDDDLAFRRRRDFRTSGVLQSLPYRFVRA